MNAARLHVVVDGDARPALRALAAARTATRSTARVLNTTLLTSLKATAAGFAVLGAQATAGGVVALTNALAPLVGLIGVLPGLAFGAAAAVGTLRLALFGMSDAFAAMSKSPEEFEEALKNLSPAAAEFARAIRSLGPEFTALREQVQESFFDDLGATVRDLGELWLPLLAQPLAAIASGFNRIFQEAAGFLSTADTVRDLTGSLNNVAQGLNNAGGAAVPLLQVFRDLVAVSSEFLPGFGTSAADAAEKLRDMVAAGRESGGIADFITAGLDAARELGAVLGNVGGILHAIMDAGPGAGLLVAMRTATQGVETFLKSVEGQDALRTFFESAAAAGEALLTVVGPLLSGISELSTVLAALATAAAPGIASFIGTLGKSIGTLAPAATRLGEALGSVLESLAPVLPVLADLISDLVVGLAPSLENLAVVVGSLALALAPVLEALITGLAPVLTTLTGAMTQFAPAWQAMGVAVAGLVAALMPGLQALATALAGAITPDVVRQFTQAITDAAPSLASLGTSVSELLTSIAPLIPTLVDVAVAILPVLVQALSNVARTVEVLTNVLTPLIDRYGQFASENAPVVIAAFDALATALGAVRTAMEWVIARFEDLQLADVAMTVIDAFADAGTWLISAGHDIISGLIDGIWEAVKAPGSGLISALEDITQMIPDLKGPAEVDAKLLAPNGRLIMGGLNAGLLDGFDDTQKLLAGMTANIAATPAPVSFGTYGSAAPPAAAGTVISIENHFPAEVAQWDADDIDTKVKKSVESLFTGATVNVRQLRGA